MIQAEGESLRGEIKMQVQAARGRKTRRTAGKEKDEQIQVYFIRSGWNTDGFR